MNNLSMHILDITQNSISGRATLIEIMITEDVTKNILEIKIRDNGKGMDTEMLTQVADPYTTTRTTRKVGMGLPLLKHSAEQAGGFLKVYSELGVGTLVQATFQRDHMDCPPIGDIAGTVVLLVAANPNLNFKYIHSINNKKYEFNTIEIKEVLGDTNIGDPKIRSFLKEMVLENLNELYVV